MLSQLPLERKSWEAQPGTLGQPQLEPSQGARPQPCRGGPTGPGVWWGRTLPTLPPTQPQVPGCPEVGSGAPPSELHTHSGLKLKCHRPVGEAQVSRPRNTSLLDETILVSITVDFLWQRQRRP